MRRVHAVAQPQARIGEADPGRLRVLGERFEREALRAAELLELERAGVDQPPAFEPGLDQVVVVVARDDHELAARHGAGERADRRGRDLQNLRERAVAKLEHVAEQHQPLCALEVLAQHGAEALAAQQVGAAAQPQVQVGDHRRAHGRIVAGWGPAQPTTQPELRGPCAGNASASARAIRCERAA